MSLSSQRLEFDPLEPMPSHIIYLVLSSFLLVYALFSDFIRNRLHLSEPPLATLVGVLVGYLVLNAVDVPEKERWHRSDVVVQEFTRVIVGIQCFAVGVDLPAGYLRRHWRSIGWLLGPTMLASWFVSATVLWLLLGLRYSTALIIGACLTPTDPVLSASVLGEAKFSSRVPRRLKQLLAAESGCNDGSAYPLLYAALFYVTKSSGAEAAAAWITEVILWQCTAGIATGVLLGYAANRALRFSEARGYVQETSLLACSILLAVLTVGVGSTLGLDVFLVSFAAGTALGWDGWFSERAHDMHLASFVDLVLNSSMFVYFGTVIPWSQYAGQLSPLRMMACLGLILVLRRIPAVLALKGVIADLRTYTEAVFAGHFGPMGVGALFLAVEARGRLETGKSAALPAPPEHGKHHEAIQAVWPVVCFMVLGSIMVHGLSALVMSVFGSMSRMPKERAPLLGGETARLTGMAAADGNETDTSEEEA